MKMKEFKINDYITLKLEHNETFIYVQGKKFLQCIRLVLDIQRNDISDYDEIESIDEAAEVFKQSLWQNKIVEGPMAQPSRFQNETITPEQEFWGHCSNLQTWVDNNYDTRLLKSDLSFPLLHKLVDVGDLKAKRVFKDEIAKRFTSGYLNVILYLLEQNYLDYLNDEEKEILYENFNFETFLSVKPEKFFWILEKFISLGIDSALSKLKDEISKKMMNENFIEILDIKPYFKEYLLDYLNDNELDQLLEKINLTLGLRNEITRIKPILSLFIGILYKRDSKFKEKIKNKFLSLWKNQKISIYSLNIIKSLLETKIIQKDEIDVIIGEKFSELINFISEINKISHDLNDSALNVLISSFIIIFEKINSEFVKKIFDNCNIHIKNKIISVLSSDVLNYSFSLTKKKPNIRYLEILSQLRDKSFVINALERLLKFTGFPFFEDLIKKIEKMDFNVPETLIQNLGTLAILLQERVELFSPEVISYEYKYYIFELFYEFELLFQQIIYGYYSNSIKELIHQITYYFKLILLLNKIIYNEIEQYSKSGSYRSLFKTDKYLLLKKSGHHKYGTLWRQKQIVLYKKLNLKPWPEMPQLRWLEKKKWENYITNRDQNIEKELDYYKFNRNVYNTLLYFIKVDITDNKLKLEIKESNFGFKPLDTNLKEKIIEFNHNSPYFILNEENIILGLLKDKTYLAECAYKLLKKIHPEEPSITIDVFFEKISKTQREKVEKFITKILSQEQIIDRTKAAEYLGKIIPKYRDKTYNQILACLDEKSQEIVIQNLSGYLFQDYDSYDYQQEHSIVEALLALNSIEAAKALKRNMKWIENDELRKKATVYVDNLLEKKITRFIKEEIYLYPEGIYKNISGLEKIYNFSNHYGHSEEIHSSVITIDGKYLLTNSKDNSIRVWDLNEKKLKKIIRFFNKDYPKSVISYDGKYIISNTYKNILKAFEIETGQLYKEFVGFKPMWPHYISAIGITHDNNLLLAACQNGDFNIWDFQSGELIKSFEFEGSEIAKIYVTSDREYVIISRYNKKLEVWKFDSFNQVFSKDLGYMYRNLTFILNPEETGIVSVAKGKNIICLDIKTGDEIWKFIAHNKIDEEIISLAISPDSKYLVSASESNVKLWNYNSKELIKSYTHKRFYLNQVYFRSNDKLIIVSSHEIMEWDLKEDTPHFIINYPKTYSTTCYNITLSPDGNNLVGGLIDGKIKIWDLASGTLKRMLDGHTDRVGVMEFSKDGRFLISSSSDWSVRFWDFQEEKLLYTFMEHKSGISTLKLSPNGKYVASGSADGTIKLWNIKKLTLENTFGKLSPKIDPEFSWQKWDEGVRLVIFSPESEIIACGTSKGNVRIWDLKSHNLIDEFKSGERDIHYMFFLQDGKHLVINYYWWIKIWDLDQKEIVRDIVLFRIFCVINLPDNNLLIAGTRTLADPILWLFNLTKNQLIGKFTHSRMVTNVLHIPNTYKLLILYKGDDLIMWDFEKSLNNPIERDPYPVNKNQVFVRCLYNEIEKELNISSINFDSIDQLEGLGSLKDVDKIIVGKDKVSLEILQKIGGISKDGEVNDLQRFFDYYKTISKKK